MNTFSTAPADFETLYIFGAGGHGREIAWLAKQRYGNGIAIVHLVDQEKFLLDGLNGNPVKLLSAIRPGKSDRIIIALGDNALRKSVAGICAAAGFTATKLVHPRAEISDSVELGAGSVVCAGCVITTNIKIGEHVHINIGTTLSHDVHIGNFSILSPGVHVSGHVKIGDGVFIGTGANIINGSSDKPLSIGDGAVIAAGACVTRSIPAGVMAAGVPAVIKS